MSGDIVISNQSTGFLKIDTLQNAMETAQILIDSQLVPTSFTKDKDIKAAKASVLIALQAGAELGLSVMNSIQGIAVIGGKPMIWGDTLLALCKSSSKFEYCHEEFDEKTQTAICKVKRKGEPEVIRTFSVEDARIAGLLDKPGPFNKPGPWTTYRKRMCQFRARNFGLRDAFADILKGMRVVEDYIGHEEVEINPFNKTVERVGEAPKEALSIVESIKSKLIPKEDAPIIDGVTQTVEERTEDGRVSDETFNKLESLIVKYLVPVETIKKWLEKAQVQHLDELTEEQALKTIKMLEAKFEGETHE